MSDEKPVSVMLEDDDSNVHTVHECSTITEAEEWIADHGDRALSEAGRYTIDAPEALHEAWQKIAAEPEVTEAPAEVLLNDFDAMRSMIVTLLTAIDGSESTSEAVDEAAESARKLLDDIVSSEDFPELRQYDEVVTQGRESLIARLSGLVPPLTFIEPVRFKDDREHFDVPAPMGLLDAYRWLRRRADEMVSVIGLVPLAYAIPGLPSIIVALDHAIKVPVPEDYLAEYAEDKELMHGERYLRKGDGGHSSRVLAEAMVTAAEFEEGSRTVRRSALQLVA